jgi:hypothetical protein
VPAGTRIDDGTVFKGTLAMFERAGFWRWLVANGTRQRQSVRSFGSAL